MCKKQQTWAPHSEPKIDVKNEAIFGFTPMTSRSRLPEIEAQNGVHKTQTIQNEKRCRGAQKSLPQSVPSIFFRIARRTSKHIASLKLPLFNQQKKTCFFLCPIRLNSTIIDNCLYVMFALRRYIRESPKRNIFPKLEMDSTNYPLPPHANVDDTNVKNRTRRSALNLKDLSFMQGPTLKLKGQGDTHRVTMKSKARLHTQ